MSEKVSQIHAVRDVDLPDALDRVDKAERYIKNIVKYMISKQTKYYNRLRMASLISVLRKNVIVKAENKRKVVRMMNTIRKFHTFWFFHKYRRIISWEVKMKEKDSIQGAYLLLKRYKNRLKSFDSTLQFISKNKVDLTDFNALKMSLEKERAIRLFKDME